MAARLKTDENLPQTAADLLRAAGHDVSTVVEQGYRLRWSPSTRHRANGDESIIGTSRGLGTCVHDGPSVVDIWTVVRSSGVPREFYLGCSLPESTIDAARQAQQDPARFQSCFISYSTRDQGFVEKLRNDLHRQGVRCWFAKHDLHAGQKLHEQIAGAIEGHDRLLLVLPRHSMQSEWVRTEIAAARRRESAQSRRILFPIGLAAFEEIKAWECFDRDTGKDSAREIREYFIPDFSNWGDSAAYEKALSRLLADLAA